MIIIEHPFDNYNYKILQNYLIIIGGFAMRQAWRAALYTPCKDCNP